MDYSPSLKKKLAVKMERFDRQTVINLRYPLFSKVSAKNHAFLLNDADNNLIEMDYRISYRINLPKIRMEVHVEVWLREKKNLVIICFVGTEK